MRGIVDLGSARLPAGGLTAVLSNRLEHATAPAREVAGLAAAVGTNFTLDLLAEASDLDADVVVEAVDELWRRRIMHEFGEGYDFSHDLLRETAYAQVSPPKRWLLHRRIAQALELLQAEDIDTVSAQLAEQYARGGRPDAGGGLLPARRRCRGRPVRPRRGDPAAPAGAVDRPQPAGGTRQGLPASSKSWRPWPHRSTPGTAIRPPELQQTLERSIALAESLGRKDSTLTGLVALWASRFVQGRIADGYQTATRALALVDPGSELSGPAHFAVGGSAVSLGMPAEGLRHLELAAKLAGDAMMLSVGTRADVQGTAWAAHAHWLLGHDDDALSSCHSAITLARAIGPPVQPGGGAGLRRHHPPDARRLSELRGTVAELRELCERYGFAYYREWALILDGWSRADESGLDLARRGISNLKSAGSFARMPYWLSLLADLSARSGRPDAARATLDAALAAGQAHDDVWWLPEVMRMRAAYDDAEAALSRLRSAAQLASAHGSVALLRRCERDLAARGARRRVSRRSPGGLRRARGRERCANGAGPSFGVS